MRKLAPMFITTSILALAAGTAFAGTDVNATDKTGSPTVSSNTNKGPLSYSDKSNTAKGSNAPMNDKAAGTTAPTSEGTAANDAGKHPDWAKDENKKEDDKMGTSTTGEKAKVKKAKTAKSETKHTMKHKESVAKTDDAAGMPTAKPNPSSDNPPASATKGEVANSLTGKSAGQ